jgi:hypothetical protein
MSSKRKRDLAMIAVAVRVCEDGMTGIPIAAASDVL